MGTLQPRPPYSNEELHRLYPAGLQLTQVQILLRHGERTPVVARFKDAGLAPFWPYCSAAKDFTAAIREADGSWDALHWTRRLESLGPNDAPQLNTGPKGEVDGICQLGELTDRGRETTLALGQRIRQLYITQLGFLPAILDTDNASDVYLRATPIIRALDSVQQAFTGLYPSSARVRGLPPPVIVTRAFPDETLFPNDGACKRFAELARAFAGRAADIYNNGPELAYINKKIGKYMPLTSPVVKVDSKPALVGIMDSINATLAHGKDTRLPSEFYDAQVVEHADRICREEWYAGYQESAEYRRLGIGALVGDLTQRMVEHTTSERLERPHEKPFKISLSGCHDTTLAAALSALGAMHYEKDAWPKFTSSVAFELFKRADDDRSETSTQGPSATVWPAKERTWWSRIFSSTATPSTTSPRAALLQWPEAERRQLDQYYVRLRYNDTPITVPFCKAARRHLEGDETFCFLAAFKEAADRITPKNWKEECGQNLGQSAFPPVVERPPGLE